MTWTEPSFISLNAIAESASRVVLRNVDGKTTPIIVADVLLRGLARLTLARHVQLKLESASPWDHTPKPPENRIGHGWAHEVYGILQGSANYDVSAALDLIEADQRDRVTPPAVGGYLNSLMRLGAATNPRRDASGAVPRARVPYSTPGGTKALADRIIAAFEAELVTSAAVDASLADDCEAAYDTKRAELLAEIELIYPGIYS